MFNEFITLDPIRIYKYRRNINPLILNYFAKINAERILKRSELINIIVLKQM